ncbi:hypothetical protein [Actinoplanes regularis]|uniref:hypothetical protein n=1 Tax=Actinoplanes regularis TaxID=52697 RepID=UPI0024A228D7|nr:hypothetical protein [Actinoplanes regularis]GLW32322.1 hypothetical protein Areg01_52610 [Actinoplanes regularis]
MKLAVGVPDRWRVTLQSGGVIEILADGYSKEGDDALFVVFMTASYEDQAALPVVGSGDRSEHVARPVLVARIPLRDIASVEGGWDWSEEELQRLRNARDD